MSLTYYLFAQPSFWSGVARTFDLFGSFDEYNSSETPSEADRRAMEADWAMVEKDLQDALSRFEKEVNAGILPTQPRLLEQA